MIFASFGNSPVPFPRLAKALEDLSNTVDEPIIVQNGHTDYPFDTCQATPFMDKKSFLNYLQRCSVAILQGGWGGISEASDLSVRTVVVPRMKDIEHYHDQEQLVRALENDGICLGCYDINELPVIVEKARTFEYKPLARGNASVYINEFLERIEI